jgi:hypothetical protein
MTQLTFIEEQRLKLVRRGLASFPQGSYPQYFGVEANEHLTLISHPDAPMSLASVHETLNRIQNRLVVSPVYVEAYRKFFAEYPEYAMEGNVSVFDGALRKLALYDGRFAPLPLDQDGRALYKIPGKEISVPLTYALWKRLPVSEMQRLLKYFGEAQINSVIQAQLS